jgi:hypothetical protein
MMVCVQLRGRRGRGGGPFVSEGIFHLQLMRVGRTLRRARIAAYKSDGR